MTRQFTAAANKREGHTHVLLITTGSVASVKAPLIIDELLKVSNENNPSPPRAYLSSSDPPSGPNPASPLVQGRFGAGGRDQTIAHVLPA
jgi:hypothetical protein